MKDLLYVGLDVDDKNFHGAGFSEETGEILEFKCKPTNKAMNVSLMVFLIEEGFGSLMRAFFIFLTRSLIFNSILSMVLTNFVEYFESNLSLKGRVVVTII